MSRDYRPLKKIHARDLFSGRLAEFGVREHINKYTTEKKRCLTDGRNYLSVFIRDDGLVRTFTGGSEKGKILKAIAEAFDTDIVAEDEPQFWGYETWEEQAEEHERFNTEILRYLRGEPHEITPGTAGMTFAKIGKRLVERDSSLLLPENRDKLLKEISSIYGRNHALRSLLLRIVEMIVTQVDDLPSVYVFEE
jgi:hypothetical protein